MPMNPRIESYKYPVNMMYQQYVGSWLDSYTLYGGSTF